MSGWYPVALQLEGKDVVVVGGGPIAQEKVRGLLEAGARVTVISPSITPALAQQAEAGVVTVRRRGYEAGDVKGAYLAIAATGDSAVHQQIWEEAETFRVLVNSVDEVSRCHFIAPAVHQQGDVTIAVFTNGTSPALASHVRNRIAGVIGPEYGGLAAVLGGLRQEVKARVKNFEDRKQLWSAVAGVEGLDLVREGRVEDVRRWVLDIVGELEKPAEAHQREGGRERVPL